MIEHETQYTKHRSSSIDRGFELAGKARLMARRISRNSHLCGTLSEKEEELVLDCNEGRSVGAMPSIARATSCAANAADGNFSQSAPVTSCDGVGSECGKRIALEPESVEKGLAKLVLTVIELLRRLMEKQAVRRMDAGELTDEQIERMGQTFMKLEEKLVELREYFGLQEEELDINLGPLGNLM